MGSDERGEGDGRAALVLGNTDGIGLGLTESLLADGWRVVGVSRRASELEHPAYTHVVADLGEGGWTERLEGLVQEHGLPDVAVYCAGIGDSSATEHPELPAERVLAVNLLGMVRTFGVLIPPMLARGSGHLVGLSSLTDVIRVHDAPAYCASKAAFSAYLESLALDLRKRGVCVTNVRFGFVDTKMAQAPVRPLMVSRDKAVRALRKALRKRPLVVSYPRGAALLAGAVGGLSRLLPRLLRGPRRGPAARP